MCWTSSAPKSSDASLHYVSCSVLDSVLGEKLLPFKTVGVVLSEPGKLAA